MFIEYFMQVMIAIIVVNVSGFILTYKKDNLLDQHRHWKSIFPGQIEPRITVQIAQGTYQTKKPNNLSDEDIDRITRLVSTKITERNFQDLSKLIGIKQTPNLNDVETMYKSFSKEELKNVVREFTDNVEIVTIEEFNPRKHLKAWLRGDIIIDDSFILEAYKKKPYHFNADLTTTPSATEEERQTILSHFSVSSKDDLESFLIKENKQND